MTPGRASARFKVSRRPDGGMSLESVSAYDTTTTAISADSMRSKTRFKATRSLGIAATATIGKRAGAAVAGRS